MKNTDERSSARVTLIAVVLLLTLIGCGQLQEIALLGHITQEQFDKIEMGMTPDEVIAITGEPYSKQAMEGGGPQLRNGRSAPALWYNYNGSDDCYVLFKREKVVLKDHPEWGTEEIRSTYR